MSLGPPVQRLKSRPVTFVFELPTEKLTEFWNSLSKGNVYASKCKKCGKVTFPPAADCSRCLSSGVEWVDLQGEGEIETFTHIVVRPTSFANHGTYTVAVAKMKEGVRVLAWLEGTKLSSVKVGAKVKLVGKVTDEGPTYAFTLI
jgi:uncharacterized OB-fold protein